MKILFILPTQYDDSGKACHVKQASVNLNLNLPLLAGLTPRDVDVEIIYDYIEPVNPDTPCDLVALSGLICTTPRAYELADAFRARGRKVVMGGFHISAMPEEALQHCDAVVVGEAEEVWAELIDDARHNTLKPIYKAADYCKLEGHPAPRYDLTKRHLYKIEVFPVESSRGCPYNCEYCAVTRFYSGKYRHRSIAEVIRNIQATGSRYIAFVDDNIIGDKEYSRELFEALIPLNIRWMAQTTMTMADDEDLLDKAVRSGLRFAWTGVESVRVENLAEVNRRFNQVEEFERRLGTFLKRGVLVGANIMMGFDHDTPDIYDETYEFIVRNKVFPFVYILTPIPGTALWDRMSAEGRVLHTNWTRYTGFRTVFQPKNFSAEEQDERYFQLVERLFSLRNNLLRSFSQIQLERFKEDFFIRLAAFIVGTNVGRIAKRRGPTYW